MGKLWGNKYSMIILEKIDSHNIAIHIMLYFSFEYQWLSYHGNLFDITGPLWEESSLQILTKGQ